MYALTLDGESRVLQLSADRTILDSCLDLGVPVPYNCRSGECGECVARLVDGRVQELPGADPATYTPAMRDAGMILTCMCYPASHLHISVPLRDGQAPPIRSVDAIVTEVSWFGERSARVVRACGHAGGLPGRAIFRVAPAASGVHRGLTRRPMRREAARWNSSSACTTAAA
jgi:ferredoxin